MKIKTVIYRNIAELILTLTKEELINLRQVLKLPDTALDTMLIQLYTINELKEILDIAIKADTLPIIYVEQIPLQVDYQFLSGLIRMVEKRNEEPVRKRKMN